MSQSVNQYLNFHKSLSVSSNLAISGVNEIIRNSSAVVGLGLNYNRVFNSDAYDISRNVSAIANINKVAGLVENFSNNHYDKLNKQYSKILGGINMNHAGIINGMGESLAFTRRSQILELGSTMKALQSSIGFMSNDLLNGYTGIVTESIKNLSAGIIKMNKNIVDFSSIASFNINELIPQLANINKPEFDEKLEDEIDLREIESIVYAEVEDINLSIKEQKGDIIVAIRELNESIKINNAKGGLINAVVAGILTNIIIIFMTFILNSINPYAPSNADIKYTIKSTKQIVRTMEVDNHFYNIIRIVVKDELEVRRSNKIKSAVKYYLDYGDLIRIEHKNKN